MQLPAVILSVLPALALAAPRGAAVPVSVRSPAEAAVAEAAAAAEVAAPAYPVPDPAVYLGYEGEEGEAGIEEFLEGFRPPVLPPTRRPGYGRYPSYGTYTPPARGYRSYGDYPTPPGGYSTYGRYRRPLRRATSGPLGWFQSEEPAAPVEEGFVRVETAPVETGITIEAPAADTPTAEAAPVAAEAPVALDIEAPASP